MNLLQSAINELKNVNVGSKFIVKDLFIGHQWNSIKISDRKILERMMKIHEFFIILSKPIILKTNTPQHLLIQYCFLLKSYLNQIINNLML